jgi:hypothetical protein
MSRRLIPVLLLVCALAAPLLAADGTAKGTLTVNGKTVQLKYAYAAQREDPFDKKKTAIQVLITDQQVPADAARDEFKLMEVRDKQHINGVSILVTDDQRIVSGGLYSPNLKKMDFVSGVGMQKLELTAMTKDRIAGHVAVPKDDFFDNVYSYDVTFDAPVGMSKAAAAAMDKPKGTPLPAGGGDVGKAYEAYRKALLAGNLAALKKTVSADKVASIDDPEFKDHLKIIQAMTPKKVTITGGAVDGDTATLLATAKEGNETSTGKITMVREGGAWKLGKESWESKSN